MTDSFIETKRREFTERLEELRPMVDEIRLLKQGLAGLNDEAYEPEPDYRAMYEEAKAELKSARASISQLKLHRKNEAEGGAKSEKDANGGSRGLTPEQFAEQARAQEAKADEEADRKPPTPVSVEQVRDCIIQHFAHRDFTTREVGEKLGISITTARDKMAELPRGMIRRPEGSPSMGSTARWEYVPPPSTGPTRRPRGEQRGPRGERAPVPHTGRPHGPTGNPSEHGTPPGTLRRKKDKGEVMRVRVTT